MQAKFIFYLSDTALKILNTSLDKALTLAFSQDACLALNLSHKAGITLLKLAH